MPKFLVRVTLVERFTGEADIEIEVDSNEALQKKLEHYNKPSNLPYDELDFEEVGAEVLESHVHTL